MVYTLEFTATPNNDIFLFVHAKYMYTIVARWISRNCVFNIYTLASVKRIGL